MHRNANALYFTGALLYVRSIKLHHPAMQLLLNNFWSRWNFCAVVACLWIISGCRPDDAPRHDDFFEQMNARHNGDYIAGYPLHNPDSCLLLIQAEVPQPLQAFACLSVWYHLPRNTPDISFRWLDLYEKHYPHDTVHAFAQLMRGEFMLELEKKDSARILLADARRRYLALNRPLDASDADYLLARCSLQENDLPAALEQYFSVLELINRHDTTFSHRHAFLYLDIASAYRLSKDLPQELHWLYKAWNADHALIEEAWKYKARTASKIASAYAKSRPDSSLIMANAAVDIFKKNSQAPVPAELQYYLGLAHFRTGDCKTAQKLLLDAFQRNTQQHDLFWQGQYAQSLGENYYCLGNLDSAEYYIRLALVSPDTGNLLGAHRLLSEIYARRNDFKTALEELKLTNQLSLHLYNTERAAALSEFEALYESTQKEARIAALESQRKIGRQRNAFALPLASVMVLFFIALWWRQRNRRRFFEQQTELMAQKKALAEAREQLRMNELLFSQAQLNTTKSQLDNTSRLLALKNQLIEELQLQLRQQPPIPANTDASAIREDSSLRSLKILTDSDWEHFRKRFEQEMPGVLHQLKTEYPQLTHAETRLFLLTKLGFDTLEISGALGISKESVWRSRHRLSKKLGLLETSLLDIFVNTF